MTINNYTFFSPTGTEFPVSSNADGKLYQMLAGLDNGTYKRKDWEPVVDTALNRQYVNTSLVVGGRYFELRNETVALNINSVNYIHANIDLTKTTAPVSISVETADNSNAVDVNNSVGVLKRCFDIITTNSTGVFASNVPPQIVNVDQIVTNKITNNAVSNWINLAPAAGVNAPAGSLMYRVKNDHITVVMNNFQTTIDSNGQKLVTTLPYNFFSSFTNVAIAFTGNAVYPWRVAISGSLMYVQGPAGVRSNNIVGSFTLPLP